MTGHWCKSQCSFILQKGGKDCVNFDMILKVLVCVLEIVKMLSGKENGKEE